MRACRANQALCIRSNQTQPIEITTGCTRHFYVTSTSLIRHQTSQTTCRCRDKTPPIGEFRDRIFIVLCNPPAPTSDCSTAHPSTPIPPPFALFEAMSGTTCTTVVTIITNISLIFDEDKNECMIE